MGRSEPKGEALERAYRSLRGIISLELAVVGLFLGLSFVFFLSREGVISKLTDIQVANDSNAFDGAIVDELPALEISSNGTVSFDYGSALYSAQRTLSHLVYKNVYAANRFCIYPIYWRWENDCDANANSLTRVTYPKSCRTSSDNNMSISIRCFEKAEQEFRTRGDCQGYNACLRNVFTGDIHILPVVPSQYLVE